LLSGSAANVTGDGCADTITLNGATVIGGVFGGDNNDTIDLLSGSAGGNVLGEADNDIIVTVRSRGSGAVQHRPIGLRFELNARGATRRAS
jgi:hypothetical protein